MSPAAKLHGLQYLRAIAALAVVYSHTTIQVSAYETYLPHHGSFGVDVFFVISGFIMLYIARDDDTPARFFVQRVRRVVPLYWFFTLLMAAILLIAPTIFRTTEFDLGVLVQSLLFVPHFSATHEGMLWPLVAPGWSLNYEMYFYLLFALSLLFAARWRPLFIACALGGVFLVAWLSASDTAFARFHADAIVFEFVFGMALALHWQRGGRLPRGVALACLAGGSAWLLAPLADLLPRLLHYGVGGLLLVAGTLHLPWPHWRVGVWLGDASYALYLSHLFVLGVLRVVLPPILGTTAIAAWTFCVLSLVICTVASLFVHAWIDNGVLRPSRWRRRPAEGAAV